MKDQVQDHLQAPVKVDLLEVQKAAEGWTPQQVLNWAFDTFGNGVAISSAFGAEGMVLIDMASRVARTSGCSPSIPNSYFPETYNLMDRIEEKYGITIEKVFSDLLSPEQQEREHGAALWQRDPDLCCSLRKVEPLRRKLDELSAWITSIRRDQTSVRSVAHKVEWDAKFGLVKINPIVDWTSKQVWRYIHDHDVPYNELHNQDYPASAARIARARSGRERIREPAAGPDLPRPSAACTLSSRRVSQSGQGSELRSRAQG